MRDSINLNRNLTKRKFNLNKACSHSLRGTNCKRVYTLFTFIYDWKKTHIYLGCSFWQNKNNTTAQSTNLNVSLNYFSLNFFIKFIKLKLRQGFTHAANLVLVYHVDLFAVFHHRLYMTTTVKSGYIKRLLTAGRTGYP